MASGNEKVNKSKKNSKKDIMSFPSNLGHHQIILKFYEYDYSRVSKGKSSHGVKASIALPLPQNIVDSSRLEVGGRQVGILGGLTTDILTGGIGSNVLNDLSDYAKNAFTEGKNIVSQATAGEFAAIESKIKAQVGGAMDASLYLLRAGIGKISPQIEQATGASAGTAVNPQNTLVFDGVDLKIHNFEWLLSPKNEKEQKELDKIIQTIQFMIHPEYKNPAGSVELTDSISRGLLSYPALMSVELHGVSGNLKTVFKSDKYMMVNQFNVDYTPQGMVLNKGGTASVIRCSMNTTESQIRTRKDYENELLGSLGDESSSLIDSALEVLEGAADVQQVIEQAEFGSQLDGLIDLADKYNVTA